MCFFFFVCVVVCFFTRVLSLLECCLLLTLECCLLPTTLEQQQPHSNNNNNNNNKHRYIFFLYWCAYPLVWGTILLYLAVHFWVTLWLWMQSGYVELGDLQNSVVFSSTTRSTNEEEISNLGQNDTATFNNGANVNGSESTDDTYLALAIISSILYAVGICIIAAVFTQVRVAVRIIQETSKALARIPTLMLYPIFSVAAICLLILYFITVGTYLSRWTMLHPTRHFIAAITCTLQYKSFQNARNKSVDNKKTYFRLTLTF